jgi:hypothetical protein
MAVSIPIVSEFVDTGIKGAMKAFSDFRTSVAQAEGGMAKFKAGSAVALDFAKKNAVAFAATAGVAIAKFAFDGAQKFQQLAIATGKFSDATGLAAEEASRLIEVAGDLDIEAGTLEGAIGKMNKTLGTSPELFKELGIEIGYSNTGAMSANETFLNVIDRLNGIKDPAERARVASQLLGKGWQSMAELIGLGSDKLRKSLAEVSEQKVISEREVKQAREYRASMDKLNDATSDLSMALGQNLIPMLTKLVEGLAKAVELSDKLGITFGNLGGVADRLKESIDKQRDAWRDGYAAMRNAQTALEYLGEKQDQVRVTTNELNYAWQALLGQFDKDEAIRSAQRSVQDLQAAAAAAFGDPSKVMDYEEATQEAYEAVARLIEIIGLTNAEQNRIKVLVDTGEIQTAIRLLEIMTKNPGFSLTDAMRFRGGRAAGGPVTAGGTYLVGERGPELLTMGARSGYVTPNHALGGGGTVNVTVTSADPNAVVAALQEWSRNNGSVPINTTANIRR